MFKVPEGVAGAHYVWVKDTSTGDVDPTPLEFTVLPKLEVSPSSGIEGDEITITGYGFGDEVDVDEENFTDTFGVMVEVEYESTETDELGTWSSSFEVPDVGYGVYKIEVNDNEDNTADVDFTIGASITLSKDVGPVGTVVTIDGRGFTEDATIDTGDVTIDGVDCAVVDGPEDVRSTGRFTVQVVIPSVDVDDHTITVTENGGAGFSAEADFEVDGEAEIDVDPDYGPVGSYVTVEGFNFTQMSGTEVAVTLEGLGEKTFETDSDGHFEGQFRIPGASGTPTILASQTDYGISAEKSFRIGLITVVLSPEEGPAGTRVSVSGAGFDVADEWSATFDGEEWIEVDDVGPGGVIAADVWVPSMDPGVYEVVVTEEDSGIEVLVDFTVTENTYLVLNPVVAPNEYSVTIDGFNFAQLPDDQDLDFILYNSTDEWDLDVMYEGSPVALEDDGDWDDGYFTGKFDVPEDEDLSIGTYMINVTDGQGMMASIEFSVVEKTQEIEPRRRVFVIGDIVSFNIVLSFAEPDSYIEIYEPDGDLFWTTDELVDDVWLKVGTVQTVPYYEQTAGGNLMELLSDAPLGEYEWEFYDSDDDLIDDGVFNVEAAPEMVNADDIEELNDQLDDLQSEVSDVSSEIAGMKSNIDEAIQAADQARDAADAATQAINSVATQATDAKQAAEDAKDAAEQAQEATQGLTTLVYGAIGAALVAALAAIVSLMQISQKIAG
jgi:regulator of replication initiation timing